MKGNPGRYNPEALKNYRDNYHATFGYINSPECKRAVKQVLKALINYVIDEMRNDAAKELSKIFSSKELLLKPGEYVINRKAKE